MILLWAKFGGISNAKFHPCRCNVSPCAAKDLGIVPPSNLHCVPKTTALACYNLIRVDEHRTILIIFDRNVAKKVSIQMILYFPTSCRPNCAFAQRGVTESRKLRFLVKRWMLLCQHTHKTHSYGHSWTTRNSRHCRLLRETILTRHVAAIGVKFYFWSFSKEVGCGTPIP